MYNIKKIFIAVQINMLSYSGSHNVSTYTHSHTHLYTQYMYQFILLQSLVLICTFPNSTLLNASHIDMSNKSSLLVEGLSYHYR